VVAFVEFPDPLVTPLSMDVWVWGFAWAIAPDSAPSVAEKSQHSEMPYRLSIAFDINFGPLALRDPGSRSMKSGDFAC